MAHQVIEHVEDPIVFMKDIKALLNPGGIVHLELPNQISLTARLRKISSIPFNVKLLNIEIWIFFSKLFSSVLDFFK